MGSRKGQRFSWARGFEGLLLTFVLMGLLLLMVVQAMLTQDSYRWEMVQVERLEGQGLSPLYPYED